MISVVIPLYNKEKQIARTLQTVLNQTYQNFEIVIVLLFWMLMTYGMLII